jgi:hypothetical protein
MLKQLVKRIGILTVVSFLYSIDIKAQDDYLVGAYYYPWYNENSWFSRGLRVATDSLLHDTSYYRNFVYQQFEILLNDQNPPPSQVNYYIDRMKIDGWRQDSVIRWMGGVDLRYWQEIAQMQNWRFVDSISLDLMGTFKPLPDDGFLSWCVTQLNTGAKTRGQIIDTMLHRTEQYKHFIDTTYWTLLGRGSDAPGLMEYTDAMAKKHWTKDSIIMSISCSPEFWDYHTDSTKEGFVNSIFTKLAGKSPSSSDSDRFVDIINNNYSYLGGALDNPQPPELGEYASNDPTIVNQHINWAADYGIDFFSCSWWGQGSYSDENIKNVLGTANSINRVKFCIFYETLGLLEEGSYNFDNDTVRAKFFEDFKYIKNTYFTRPSYLKIDNKPVVMVYSASCFNGDYVSAFAQLPDSLGCDVFLIGDVDLWKSPREQTQLISIFDAVTKYHMYEAGAPSNVGYPDNTTFFQKVEGR